MVAFSRWIGRIKINTFNIFVFSFRTDHQAARRDREEEARLGRQEDPREGQLERGQQGAAGEQARGQSEH